MDGYVGITTIDNPFNPFSDFSSWFLFDVEKGYNTCSYLARTIDSFNLSRSKQNSIDDEIELAINEIIKHDFRNIYRKITKV